MFVGDILIFGTTAVGSVGEEVSVAGENSAPLSQAKPNFSWGHPYLVALFR